MKKTELAVTRTESIIDEVSQHFDRIRARAFELFQSRDGSWAGEFDDWLKAERELSIEPAIELKQADGGFEIDALLPGMDPKDLDVQVTAEDVLITGKRPETATAPADRDPMKTFERIFCAVHLPSPINPDLVKADYHKGHLHLTAPMMEPMVKKIEVRV